MAENKPNRLLKVTRSSNKKVVEIEVDALSKLINQKVASYLQKIECAEKRNDELHHRMSLLEQELAFIREELATKLRYTEHHCTNCHSSKVSDIKHAPKVNTRANSFLSDLMILRGDAADALTMAVYGATDGANIMGRTRQDRANAPSFVSGGLVSGSRQPEEGNEE